MEKVKIIIIDSGVRKSHPRFAGDDIRGYTLHRGKKQEDFEDKYGHGTAIYNIIRKCNDIADILNIKISDVEHGVEQDILIDVLEYIYKNEEADIINLSLGVSASEGNKRLQDICSRLTQKGVILCSAFDNSGAVSYPACFDNVIGVVSDEACKKVSDYKCTNSSFINIAGYGRIQRLAWCEPDYIMLGGNSFACAHITVMIAQILYGAKGKKQNVIEKLQNGSIGTIYFEKNHIKNNDKNHMIEIKRVALFPFNKEMHGLIRFSDSLDFDIAAVYDTKYSARIGADTKVLIHDDVKQLTIKNINNIEWEEFDTLILGHLDELNHMGLKEDIKSSIIKEALLHNKKIYAFDDLSDYITEENSSLIYFPRIDSTNLPPNYFGKLFRISRPVLGVFGTSSKQGKFTLQMKLRGLFQNDGYKVGQIGTEPSALLYGMDFVYPMGYNSSVKIKEYDAVRYLNSCINELCSEDSDIIIVGSQSGTVSYDVGNIVQFNIPQYNFLLGTQPEAVVLCINPYDDIDYIKRTINFIEASVCCKVLGLVVFPMNLKSIWKGIYGSKEKLTEEEFLELKDRLEKEIGIDVYNLGTETDIKILYNSIVDYFSW